MLTEFQIESGYMATAQILADAPYNSHRQNSETLEIITFELSASVWTTMFACYAIFFIALILATGHSTAAIFALAVSIGYTIMYFGAASMLNRVSAPERATSPLRAENMGMETQTGWMTNSAINGQVLIVPIALVLFSCSFAIIGALM